MDQTSEQEKKLFSYQDKIDKQYKIFAKNDFALKLTFFNSMKLILKERDEFITDLNNNGIDFWERVCQNCQLLNDLLPDDSEISFIESLKCFYEENYTCGVEIILKKNEYLYNRKLSKKFNLLENDSEGTELKTKKETNCLLFDFFKDNDNDLEVFDILFEIYTNAAQYFFIK
ncbi:DNA replication factor/protein phosphatase inhibitor SET/SPR-2 [Pseudoloma neurophilia]|uniref:DNA replication factor/protein phosphatase inhibitor SET/SPR-2 n=1 Tax=Pseudoloma neurophilia TaxID=146866 RepID=A0A0R0LVN1_9MICR|nr:DNA replication factor/protein phosphatase inhibitor SET/SPR-2 [Pseudoloma neurophilia]